MATPAARSIIDAQVASLLKLQTNVVDACWAKCVPRPRDADLTLGEMTCIDRCVPKYIEAQAAVRTELEAARRNAPLDFP